MAKNARGVYFYLFGYMHSGINSEILVSYGKFGIFAEQIHTKYFQNCIQILRQYIHSIENLYFFRINDRFCYIFLSFHDFIYGVVCLKKFLFCIDR